MTSEPENNKNQEPRRAEFASRKGEVVLRPHEYDGIQEFDQKLPNWWLMTFYGAIIFYLLFWFIYYQAGLIKTDQAIVTDAMGAIQDQKQRALEETLATLDDKTLVNDWATDPAIVSQGEGLYMKQCFTCHGPNLDSPNKLGLSLVDGTWKYGDKPTEIFKLINDGTPADSKGMEPTGARMIPWGAVYNPKEIAQLVAFIISKNPNDFKDF
jgi:cytochrome c oxidase cbb3-type subunit 3